MWIRGFLALCAVALASARILTLKDLAVSNFAEEIDKWIRLNEESELFKEAVDLLRLPTELQRSDWRSFPNGRDIAICTVCKSGLKAFIDLRRKGLSDELIRDKGVKFCILLNLQTENVCKGVIELNLPTILYIVDNKPNLTSSSICGVLLESRSCPITDPEFDWTVQVDTGPIVSIPESKERPPIKVVQITDVHYDPKYEPSGNSFCDEPTCCRKGQNATNDSGKLAGYWGDYNYCDTPWHAVVDAFDHIRDTHENVEYVYFTGDIIDHGVWETSREENTVSMNKTFEQLKKTFDGVPVYPILGNHEPHPLNLFAPKTVTREDLSTQWLYNLIADLWINLGWLPESTRSTILQGGFYTLSPTKGFRIIVLNSNVCYAYNWWLWYQPRYPDNQLQWLADTLLEAERNGEFVHILSHIPANDKHCISTWRREYLKIVSRFSHVIKAQFNGHSHNDEIQVFYDEEYTANNMAWNGGSVTSYTKLNPNYKVYHVDGNNYAVADYDNWMYNLTAANLNTEQRPTWYKSYSFKEEYGLNDLSAESLNAWLSAGLKSDDVINKYYRNFFKLAEPSLMTSCDANCKSQYLCRTITNMNADKICKNLKG